MGRFILLSLFLGLVGVTAPAQAQTLGQLVSPILTIDREAIFGLSQFGQRVTAELEAESQALAEETRKIEQELEAEELDLSERRATMTPEEFRALADAFDEKVVELRADRDAAQTSFLQRLEQAELEFYTRIGPVLGQMMQERGAVAILDKRSVLLSINAIDVTQAAISRIDAVIGAGASAEDGTPDGSE